MSVFPGAGHDLSKDVRAPTLMIVRVPDLGAAVWILAAVCTACRAPTGPDDVFLKVGSQHTFLAAFAFRYDCDPSLPVARDPVRCAESNTIVTWQRDTITASLMLDRHVDNTFYATATLAWSSCNTADGVCDLIPVPLLPVTLTYKLEDCTSVSPFYPLWCDGHEADTLVVIQATFDPPVDVVFQGGVQADTAAVGRFSSPLRTVGGRAFQDVEWRIY